MPEYRVVRSDFWHAHDNPPLTGQTIIETKDWRQPQPTGPGFWMPKATQSCACQSQSAFGQTRQNRSGSYDG